MRAVVQAVAFARDLSMRSVTPDRHVYNREPVRHMLIRARELHAAEGAPGGLSGRRVAVAMPPRCVISFTSPLDMVPSPLKVGLLRFGYDSRYKSHHVE